MQSIIHRINSRLKAIPGTNRKYTLMYLINTGNQSQPTAQLKGEYSITVTFGGKKWVIHKSDIFNCRSRHLQQVFNSSCLLNEDWDTA